MPTQLNFSLDRDLFRDICSLPALGRAFKDVRKNKGAPGIDGVTVHAFEISLEENLHQLREELINWCYKPQPVRRVNIPKPGGGTRNLGVPCVRDRVLQTSIKLVLEPIYDPTFSTSSFGFRPRLGQRDALDQAKQIVNSGREWTVDIDLAQFFDEIHHDRLISRMGRTIKDKRVLRLIGLTLRSGTMSNGVFDALTKGSVQGSPLSPLLSNIVLDELDKELEKRGHKFCRFADDLVAFVTTPRSGERVMRSLTTFIERKLKLKVNSEKSQVVPTQRMKFLGMTIIAGTLAISLSSMNRAMGKVKELTPRGTSLPIEQSIKRINSWYKGWSGYYLITEYPSQLRKVEAHVRRRLRCRWLAQQKRRRYMAQSLVKRGVKAHNVYRYTHSNRGLWALSHSFPVDRGLPNKWFKQRGLWTRSEHKLLHWKPVKTWVRLT